MYSIEISSVPADLGEDVDLLLKWPGLLVLEEYCSKSGFSVFVAECMKNAGSEGTGRVREKLLSIRTTEAIVGLSLRSS